MLTHRSHSPSEWLNKQLIGSQLLQQDTTDTKHDAKTAPNVPLSTWRLLTGLLRQYPEMDSGSIPSYLTSSRFLLRLQRLNPYNRLLCEKLTNSQLLRKFPLSCGSRRFIIALTSARHLLSDVAWGVQPPTNSEVLSTLSRIPSSIENTSVTT
jgi:hypothetical protein